MSIPGVALSTRNMLSPRARRAAGPGPRQGQPALVGQGPQERSRVRARSVARVHAVDRECLGRVRAQKTAYFFGECPLGRTELEVHEGGRQDNASVQPPPAQGRSACYTAPTYGTRGQFTIVNDR